VWDRLLENGRLVDGTGTLLFGDLSRPRQQDESCGIRCTCGD
jgi:hypothetical protein